MAAPPADPNHTDVIIIGAGPTGLTLACDLARRGVPFRILDNATHTRSAQNERWWRGFDPTNNVLAAERHIVCAVGRDYSDVAPVKGVAMGGGEQVINVSVAVLPA